MSDGQEIVEDAIAKRLSRLGAMPVDLSSLERSIRSQIPAPAAPRSIWKRAWRVGASIAASLIVVATVVFAVAPAREVRANPIEIARVHREMIRGSDTLHVSSMDAANDAIAAMAQGLVKVPDVKGAVPHACCMRKLGNKPVACVLLEDSGRVVSMTVARAADMKSPASSLTKVRAGVTYHVSTVEDLTMVMTEREGRWICLVGDVGEARLIELGAQIKF